MATYVTVGVVGTAATNAVQAINLKPDGSTLAEVKVPGDALFISRIGYASTMSAGGTLDTFNGLVVRLSGVGMKDGEQHIVIGGHWNDETGTSVTGGGWVHRATYEPTAYRTVPNAAITVSGFYNGTDQGSQVFVITFEFR